jgi:hypothetical protein
MPASSPSTTLYALGRGIVSIAAWTGTTPPGTLDDVGNCPRFEVEVTEETLDHFSSRSGTKLKDKQVVIETGYTLNFDLDEWSVANLAMFLKGTVTGGNVVSANTVLDAEYAVAFASDNPAGPNETWEFHRCKLSPGGNMSLISDEWALMTFSGEGLADTANQPTSPYFTVTFATTTTTTV